MSNRMLYLELSMKQSFPRAIGYFCIAVAMGGSHEIDTQGHELTTKV